MASRRLRRTISAMSGHDDPVTRFQVKIRPPVLMVVVRP
jgi:hypothetical protein